MNTRFQISSQRGHVSEWSGTERAPGQVSAPIDVDFGARTAWPDVYPPPILLVAVREIAPADEALGRQTDLVAPDLERSVVGRVCRGGEALRRDPEVDREQLPRPVDGLPLEVVAQASSSRASRRSVWWRGVRPTSSKSLCLPATRRQRW